MLRPELRISGHTTHSTIKADFLIFMCGGSTDEKSLKIYKNLMCVPPLAPIQVYRHASGSEDNHIPDKWLIVILQLTTYNILLTLFMCVF